jgi:tRNA threonylcarbamoyladenosine biosynthesis protein TsaE
MVGATRNSSTTARIDHVITKDTTVPIDLVTTTVAVTTGGGIITTIPPHGTGSIAGIIIVEYRRMPAEKHSFLCRLFFLIKTQGVPLQINGIMVAMEKRVITSLDELAHFACEVVSSLVVGEQATVIALSGDLGAGKTALVKALARELGVAHEITSPTFVVMKSYPIPSHSFFKTLTHVDAYRIEDEDEMRVLGFGDILKDSTQIVCIEWPEQIPQLIPKDALHISLELNIDESRSITITGMKK